MDTESLIKEAKLKFSHIATKQYLKEKYEAKLIVAEQFGLWKADEKTISFLSSFDTDELILIDTFGNPVKVNRVELLKTLQNVYQTVMQEWYNEYSATEYKR